MALTAETMQSSVLYTTIGNIFDATAMYKAVQIWESEALLGGRL